MTRLLTPAALPRTATQQRSSPGDTLGPTAQQPGRSNPAPSTFEEFPPRGLQALQCATLSLRAPLPVEPRLTPRAQAATAPLRQRDRISAQEIPLAAYVAARALDGRKVEGEDLERLRRSDESLREARALLPFGRGNVVQDQRGGFSDVSAHVEAARLSEFTTLSPSAAARAIWAGAGNCGEYAVVTTFAHAGRLTAGSGETVVMLGNLLADHGWAESVIPKPWTLSSLWKPDETAIVLDAWKDGPAVFAPDSTRSQWKWLGARSFIKVAMPRPELLMQAKGDARHIAFERDPRNISSARRPSGLLRAQSGVSEAFVQRAIFKSVSSQQVLDVALKGNPASETTATPAMPAEVRKGIVVAGVAREFLAAPEPQDDTRRGWGRVRSAVDHVPTLLNAIGQLTQVQVRRHHPGIPSSLPSGFSYGGILPRLVTRPAQSDNGETASQPAPASP